MQSVTAVVVRNAFDSSAFRPPLSHVEPVLQVDLALCAALGAAGGKYAAKLDLRRRGPCMWASPPEGNTTPPICDALLLDVPYQLGTYDADSNEAGLAMPELAGFAVLDSPLPVAMAFLPVSILERELDPELRTTLRSPYFAHAQMCAPGHPGTRKRESSPVLSGANEARWHPHSVSSLPPLDNNAVMSARDAIETIADAFCYVDLLEPGDLVVYANRECLIFFPDHVRYWGITRHYKDMDRPRAIRIAAALREH